MTTEIKKYTFKPGLPQEFEIVDIGQLYRKFKNTLTAAYRTGFYHILWFQKGNPTHLVDFNPVKVQSNSLLFLNKDTVQRFDKEGGFDGKAILFTNSFFCRTEADTKYLRNSILFNDLFAVSQIQATKAGSQFAYLIQQMELELSNDKDVFQSDILKNLLHNFLLLSERERRKENFFETKKSADLDLVILFKDLLETNFSRLKQVSKYTKIMSVTEKRLNHATIKVLGKLPKQIINERVMLESKRLLAHTNESVKEIGFDLGFDEPTNFIKFFRKHNNSTPIEFREQLASA